MYIFDYEKKAISIDLIWKDGNTELNSIPNKLKQKSPSRKGFSMSKYYFRI